MRNKQNHWSDADHETLIRLYNEGLLNKEIGARMGRTFSSIEKKIRAMRDKGLLPVTDKATTFRQRYQHKPKITLSRDEVFETFNFAEANRKHLADLYKEFGLRTWPSLKIGTDYRYTRPLVAPLGASLNGSPAAMCAG